MPNLYELTKKLWVGDKLAWVAEKSVTDVERVHTKKITNIEHEGETIKVVAEGTRGGEYYYIVEPDGQSEAFFVNPSKQNPTPRGSVAFAELTDSEMVTVKRGVYRNR
jgi:hypothetical protein